MPKRKTSSSAIRIEDEDISESYKKLDEECTLVLEKIEKRKRRKAKPSKPVLANDQ